MISQRIKETKLLVKLLICPIVLLSCSANKIIVGKVYYDLNNIECTKMHCIPSCCNECETSLLFVTEKDTLSLFGNIRDTAINCRNNVQGTKTCDTIITLLKNQQLTCRGKECSELKCDPFSIKNQYILTGHQLQNHKQLKYLPFEIVQYTQKNGSD